MKYVTFDETTRHENSSSCTVHEYGGTPAIDGAVAEIDGRYPDTGWVCNTQITELVYVLEGEGELIVQGGRAVKLAIGGLAVIEPNETYHFMGSQLRILMASTPAWNPEQHKVIPE